MNHYHDDKNLGFSQQMLKSVRESGCWVSDNKEADIPRYF